MDKNYETVDSIEGLQNTITRVRKAQNFHKKKLMKSLRLLQLQQIKQEYLLHKWL